MKKFNMKEFKEVLKKLNSVPWLNWGGCAISALALKRYLKKYYKKDCEVVYLWSCVSDSYDNNLKGKPDSCGHAVIKINNRHYDSEGLHSTTNRYKYTVPDEEYLIKSINQKNRWNKDFNRLDISIIEDILGISLSDVEIF